MRFFLPVFVLIAVLAPQTGAFAQSLPSRTAGKIIVYHYVPDPANGTPALADKWEFQNPMRWFNQANQFAGQTLVTREQLKFVNPRTESFTIIETNPDDTIARYVSLQDGVISVSLYKRRFGYYEDAQDLAGYLASVLKNKQTQPPTSAGDKLPSVLNFQTWAKGSPRPVLWNMEAMKDAIVVRSYLRDLPPIDELKLNQSETDFKGPGSIRIEVQTKALDIPMEISLEDHRIRTAQIEIENRIYFDQIGMEAELRHQIAALSAEKEGKKDGTEGSQVPAFTPTAP